MANSEIYWVDEDGGSVVRIKDRVISINNLSNFYYFDQLFTSIRQGKTSLRVCIGEGIENQTGMPTDCLKTYQQVILFIIKGKNRAIHVDMFSVSFHAQSIEEYLNSGNTMRISIDNNDLYYASALNQTYKLTEESEKILKLPD